MANTWCWKTAIVAQCVFAFFVFSEVAAATAGRGTRSLRQHGPFSGGILWSAPQGQQPQQAPQVEAKVQAAVAAAPVSFVLGRQPKADPKASLAKASEAAKNAWKVVEDVKTVTEDALKFPPLVQAEASNAKVAAKTASEAAKESAKIVDKVMQEATKAAFEEAKKYFEAVRAAGAAGKGEEGAVMKVEASKAELKAARAAAEAAFPYHQQILRGQKVIVDYQTRAQELAAASNALKAQGQTLAGSANGYQAVGQVVQAQQMMMQAHSLAQQGKAMQNEAERLHAAALEINAALPTYHLAEQAAAQSAAAQANPPTLDIMGSMLPY